MYDGMYFTCLNDSNAFTELMEADLDDDVIKQITADVCLVHHQVVDVPGCVYRKAVDELYDCDYVCHYVPRTSVRPHYFTINNALPWLD